MRTVLLATTLKWFLLLLTYIWAIRLKNQAPSWPLPRILPIKVIYGRIADLIDLRVFEYMAYMYKLRKRETKLAKMKS